MLRSHRKQSSPYVVHREPTRTCAKSIVDISDDGCQSCAKDRFGVSYFRPFCLLGCRQSAKQLIGLAKRVSVKWNSSVGAGEMMAENVNTVQPSTISVVRVPSCKKEINASRSVSGASHQYLRYLRYRNIACALRLLKGSVNCANLYTLSSSCFLFLPVTKVLNVKLYWHFIIRIAQVTSPDCVSVRMIIRSICSILSLHIKTGYLNVD